AMKVPTSDSTIRKDLPESEPKKRKREEEKEKENEKEKKRQVKDNEKEKKRQVKDNAEDEETKNIVDVKPTSSEMRSLGTRHTEFTSKVPRQPREYISNVEKAKISTEMKPVDRAWGRSVQDSVKQVQLQQQRQERRQEQLPPKTEPTRDATGKFVLKQINQSINQSINNKVANEKQELFPEWIASEYFGDDEIGQWIYERIRQSGGKSVPTIEEIDRHFWSKDKIEMSLQELTQRRHDV
ncbi:cyclophilin-RNA interacting protein, partial [Reticulomyxa filosa]